MSEASIVDTIHGNFSNTGSDYDQHPLFDDVRTVESNPCIIKAPLSHCAKMSFQKSKRGLCLGRRQKKQFTKLGQLQMKLKDREHVLKLFKYSVKKIAEENQGYRKKLKHQENANDHLKSSLFEMDKKLDYYLEERSKCNMSQRLRKAVEESK